MFLIDDLITSGYLKTPEIIDAFRNIKRADFILPEDLSRVEADEPLSIGDGQTISQPATVAFMLEKLSPQTGDKILDVGAGSGWTTALLARIAGAKGKVYGVERIERLKNFAERNVNKYGFIKSGAVHIFYSDGFNGLPERAPFDKILVSAAAEEIPEKLLEQLRVGGRLVIPVGERFESQSIMAADKISETEFKKREYPGFVFVPLIKNNL